MGLLSQLMLIEVIPYLVFFDMQLPGYFSLFIAMVQYVHIKDIFNIQFLLFMVILRALWSIWTLLESHCKPMNLPHLEKKKKNTPFSVRFPSYYVEPIFLWMLEFSDIFVCSEFGCFSNAFLSYGWLVENTKLIF